MKFHEYQLSLGDYAKIMWWRVLVVLLILMLFFHLFPLIFSCDLNLWVKIIWTVLAIICLFGARTQKFTKKKMLEWSKTLERPHSTFLATQGKCKCSTCKKK